MEDNPSQSNCVLKRKLANDKNGNDGNERKPKAQRANSSLDTSMQVKELEEHSKQMPACIPGIEKHDGLSQQQVNRMKKEGARKETEEEKGNGISGIASPQDKNTPSPYHCNSFEEAVSMEINLIKEMGCFVARRLPQLMAEDLRGEGLPDAVVGEVQKILVKSVLQLTAHYVYHIPCNYLD
ncbi:hypothetical protein FGLOB1_13715 [Fusarium globosum]|uniref:Uncharacterized protein n=1 Tax=Fusarium globosum TaxID=78864 RepID=A0A8H5XLW9_9HYPO|nr:hypothetical protein FGLOB1_13715 [Fusarium globosum]